MNEQKLIKKQLLKNMLFTFILFTIILVFFDAIIYNQVSLYLYRSIDEELNRTTDQMKNETKPEEILNKKNNRPNDNMTMIATVFKMNPRLIYIIRDSEGKITNSDTIGRFYDDYLENISFDKNITNKIYSIKIQDAYVYRAITIETQNSSGEIIYVQLLANVDRRNANNKQFKGCFINWKRNNYISFNNLFLCNIKKNVKTNFRII